MTGPGVPSVLVVITLLSKAYVGRLLGAVVAQGYQIAQGASPLVAETCTIVAWNFSRLQGDLLTIKQVQDDLRTALRSFGGKSFSVVAIAGPNVQACLSGPNFQLPPPTPIKPSPAKTEPVTRTEEVAGDAPQPPPAPAVEPPRSKLN